MTEEQKAAAQEHWKRVLARAPTRRELAWFEIKRGIDPKWVAHKYGYPVETMIAARAKADAEKAAKKVAA